MSDHADRAQAIAEQIEALMRPLPYVLPEGTAGDCEICGEWSSRLIEVVCASCRDRLGLE